MQPAFEATHESSLLEVLGNYQKRGFRGDFSVRPGACVRCNSCRAVEPVEQVPLRAMRRMEGASDPSEQVAVAALECPACGEWGTLVVPFGPAGTPDDMSVLGGLLDDREHSSIPPGV
jgi:Na+-translocating ferredoxin:NAD+ oxidoreductase RnfC subunit